ncbi:MAG TPA: YfhO family protein [Aggregatilineaceae bacterium]|nr:YfhO family protein [Aggregatilineaceae bacterium]
MIKRHGLILVLFFSVLVALFWRLLIGEVLFWGLPSLQFYPWRHFAFEQILDGHLPAWNPYGGAGAPLLANYQTAVFYPPNWLMLLLPDPQAMGVIALLHVIWAGFGMWLFSDTLHLPSFGRSITTLSFAFSGYLIGRFGSFPTLNAGVWIPWLFWLVYRIITQRRWSDVGWLGLAFGMQLLAGHAQTTWYGAVGLGCYTLWIVFWQHDRFQPRLLALLMAGIGMVLGVAIAAIQLVPTAEYLLESHRASGLDYRTAANLSYHPLRLLTLFSPNFMGNPADGSYLAKGIFFEDHAYIGFIPLVSAFAAIIGFRRRKRENPAFATVPFWALLALITLILAFGRYTPIFRFLYDTIPTFDAFREPVRWLILPVFSLSILAGIGTLHWGRGKWIVFWSRLAAAGGGGIVIVALVSRQFLNLESDTLNVLALGMIVLGCWITSAALLTLTQPIEGAPRFQKLWRAAVLVFVAVDLAWAGSGLNPSMSDKFYDPVQIERPAGRVYWFEDTEDRTKYEEYDDPTDYRIAADRWYGMRTSLLPNFNMYEEIESYSNDDPLLPRYYGNYVELIEDLGVDSSSLLQAAGVTQVYRDEECPVGWQGEAPLCISAQDTLSVWLVTDAMWRDSDSDIETALSDPMWNPAQTVILAGDSENTLESSEMNNAQVIELDTSPHQRRYHVESDQPAYLVISQTWYPGWTATVNGKSVDLYRANLAFQAVALPAGSSDVELEYRITHFAWGAAVSGLGLIMALGLVGWWMLKSRLSR